MKKNDIDQNVVFYEKKQELANLKEYFMEIYKEYEDLTKESKFFHRKYCFLFGEILYKRYQAYLFCFRLKRKLELFQTYINQQRKIDFDDVEAKLDNEMLDYFEKLHEILQDYVEAVSYFHNKSLSKEEFKELRRIYYKIAHRVHPDIIDDYGEVHKDLWERTLDAYQRNDLKEMKQCEFLLDNLIWKPPSETTSEKIDKEIKKYRMKIKEYKEKNQNLVNSFPYSQGHLLNDKKYVESELAKLSSEILAYQEKAEKYLAILDDLKPLCEDTC